MRSLDILVNHCPALRYSNFAADRSIWGSVFLKLGSACNDSRTYLLPFTVSSYCGGNVCVHHLLPNYLRSSTSQSVFPLVGNCTNCICLSLDRTILRA